MIFRKQYKQYDNEVSTFDASFALFIMSVGIITLNSLVCIGTMMYTNYNYTPINPINPSINIDKNLFTGIWYKIDSNYSNLHIYQNNNVSFKNEPNTNLVNGYVDYKTNAIYINDDTAYNISYVHSINNAYSFTILYDNACKKYNVYRKYNYVVNIALINKLVASLL
jgi:hypothetical protein